MVPGVKDLALSPQQPGQCYGPDSTLAWELLHAAGVAKKKKISANYSGE